MGKEKGWPVGQPFLLQPTNGRIDVAKKKKPLQTLFARACVNSEGIEPPTSWAVTRCSIQLSYESIPFGDTKVLFF